MQQSVCDVAPINTQTQDNTHATQTRRATSALRMQRCMIRTADIVIYRAANSTCTRPPGSKTHHMHEHDAVGAGCDPRRDVDGTTDSWPLPVKEASGNRAAKLAVGDNNPYGIIQLQTVHT